jgi:Xaa-Pro dipeptidase
MNASPDHLYPAHLARLRATFDAALEASGFERVVIGSGGQRYFFRDDMAAPFRCFAGFKWWVPVTDNPNCYVVHARGGARPTVLFWQPRDYWHLPAAAPDAPWTREVDLVLIEDPSALARHLPADLSRTAFLGEPEAAADALAFGARNPATLFARLDHQRAWKSAYEVACLERATASGVRAHRAAEAAFRAGGSEFEIHVEYCRAAGQVENALPYGNIVALNEHAAVLHYQHQARERPAARRSFLIDAGASYRGYGSDITRTYSAQRDEFQALIDALDAGERRLCQMVKPGVEYPTLQRAAHLEVGAALVGAGIIDLDPEAAFAARVTHAFFPHGVGHLLGLNVHDAGGFSAGPEGGAIAKPEGEPYLRLTRRVEAGWVFTIEPGLYFIPLLLDELRASPHAAHVDWRKVEALTPFGGIRIEDDVLVTDSGHRNLTREAYAAAAV